MEGLKDLKLKYIKRSIMNTKIYKVMCAGVVAVALTACSDDFLEVTNPTGEPL